MTITNETSSSPTTAATDPAPIFEIATGFMAAKALFAASELGLFEALAESPAPLAALAARCGLTPRATRISADAMIAMNAAAEIDGKSFSQVAREWLAAGGPAGAKANVAPSAAASTTGASTAADARPSSWRTGLAGKIFDENLGRLTRQHLTLVLLAVGLACLMGVPLGVLAAVYPRLRQVVLGVTGVLGWRMVGRCHVGVSPVPGRSARIQPPGGLHHGGRP